MKGEGDHAIVTDVSADDRELRDRLAALEAEVKAESDAKRALKEQALVKVRAERVRREKEKQELAVRQAAIVQKQSRRQRAADDDEDVGPTALELVARGSKLKNELAKPREKGEKSWIASGVLSFLFGPIGWLYAGSFREAIPGSLLYLLAMTLLMKLPVFLLWPVMMVALPLSGIAGVVYALQYNRKGERTRLYGKDDDEKRLESGD